MITMRKEGLNPVQARITLILPLKSENFEFRKNISWCLRRLIKKLLVWVKLPSLNQMTHQELNNQSLISAFKMMRNKKTALERSRS